jgi:hypothetical protein
MDAHPSGLELDIVELSRSVDELSRRVAALEALTPLPAGPRPLPFPSPTPAPELPRIAPAAAPVAADADLTAVAGLVGRTLLALGGAYLLRALTAADLLPQGIGVLLAFLYALAWLALADRAGRLGNPASAAFHGATAILIGFPLLWEATARFHYLGPPASGAAVGLFAACALAVAWRRRLYPLAWAAGAGAAVCALALVVATHAWVPFTVDLLFLGLAGIVLAYDRGWRALGWALGAVVHAALLLLLVGTQIGNGGAPRGAGIVLALALALSFLGAFSYRTLVRGAEVTLFEAVLGGASFVVGYGGAALLAGSGGVVGGGVGGLGVLLGLGFYGAAFFSVPRSARRKLLFASTLGLAFLLAGSALVLGGAGSALAIAWSALAVLAAWRGVRQSRVTLSLHGAVYAVAAAFASGLATAAAWAFAAPASATWPPLSVAALLSLAAAAVCAALPVPLPAPFWGPYASLTRFLRLAVFVFGAGGVLLHLLAPAIAGRPGSGVDAGLLATARTAVLAASALLLGTAARWERFREAAWLVYPVLVLAGIKLMLEDFPQGRPATLFVALALCGVALLFAPRLAKRAAA